MLNNPINFGFYHVMLRGNRRERIFFEDKHRKKFYGYLENIVRQYDCKIHLFCLMTNHVHLVLEAQTIPLPKIMQTLSSSYTRYINSVMKLTGHLFQGHYKGLPIHCERYLLKLCQYIHLNPLQANIVRNIVDYPWSSHQGYIGRTIIPWLDTSYLNQLIAENCDSSYQAFIQSALESDFDASDIMSFDKVEKRIEEIIVPINATPLNRYSHLKLQDIIQVVCQHMDETEERIKSNSVNRRICLTRSLIAYFGHYQAKFTLKRISLFLNQNPRAVARTLHKRIHEKSIEEYISNINAELIALNDDKEKQLRM